VTRFSLFSVLWVVGALGLTPATVTGSGRSARWRARSVSDGRRRGAGRLKDIAVTCVSFAPSGTNIDTNNGVIYERFEPRDVKQIKDFNMGFVNSQTTSTSCSITDLVITD
jgi:hypothetical protein